MGYELESRFISVGSDQIFKEKIPHQVHFTHNIHYFRMKEKRVPTEDLKLKLVPVMEYVEGDENCYHGIFHNMVKIACIGNCLKVSVPACRLWGTT